MIQNTTLARYQSYYRPDDAAEITMPLFVKINEAQEDCYAHTHDFSELIIITAGDGEHWIDGETYSVKAGDIFA